MLLDTIGSVPSIRSELLHIPRTGASGRTRPGGPGAAHCVRMAMVLAKARGPHHELDGDGFGCGVLTGHDLQQPIHQQPGARVAILTYRRERRRGVRGEGNLSFSSRQQAPALRKAGGNLFFLTENDEGPSGP